MRPIPTRRFLRRLAFHLAVATGIVIASLSVGTAGYSHFEKLRGTDAGFDGEADLPATGAAGADLRRRGPRCHADDLLAVALPPHSFGVCVRAILLESVEEQRWRVTIDGHALSTRFARESSCLLMKPTVRDLTVSAPAPGASVVEACVTLAHPKSRLRPRLPPRRGGTRRVDMGRREKLVREGLGWYRLAPLVR